jgi:ATP-dependent Clp protease adapter protein ClpS
MYALRKTKKMSIHFETHCSSTAVVSRSDAIFNTATMYRVYMHSDIMTHRDYFTMAGSVMSADL